MVSYAYITYFHLLLFTLTLLSSLVKSYFIFIISFYLNLLTLMSKQCLIVPLFLKSWSNLQHIYSTFMALALGHLCPFLCCQACPWCIFKMFQKCYHVSKWSEDKAAIICFKPFFWLMIVVLPEICFKVPG